MPKVVTHQSGLHEAERWIADEQPVLLGRLTVFESGLQGIWERAMTTLKKILTLERNGVQLTEREKEVLKQVAQGPLNKSGASRLSISKSTVNHQLSNVYQKRDVTDPAPAIRDGLGAEGSGTQIE